MIAFFWWRAPALTEEKVRLWGGRVYRDGPDHFLWQFRKWVGMNITAPPEPNSVVLDLEDGPPKPRLDSFFRLVQAVIHPAEYVLMAGAILLALACTWYVGVWDVLWWMLGLLFAAWGIWLASLFIGFHRYRLWLGNLVAVYETWEREQRAGGR